MQTFVIFWMMHHLFINIFYRLLLKGFISIFVFIAELQEMDLGPVHTRTKLMQRNGTERNGTERNGTERNGTERYGTVPENKSIFAGVHTRATRKVSFRSEKWTALESEP